MLRHLSFCSTAGRPPRPAHSGGWMQTQEIEALFLRSSKSPFRNLIRDYRAFAT
jgi:hypothetical protein